MVKSSKSIRSTVAEAAGIKLTAHDIEKLVTKDITTTKLDSFSQTTYLDFAEDCFKLDNSTLLRPELFQRVAASFGRKGFVKKSAQSVLDWLKREYPVGEVIVPDEAIAEWVAEFGRDEDKILNVVNVQNAILLYLGKRDKKTPLFADHTFITLNRLYFAEILGELAIAEYILEFLQERGMMESRHITKMQNIMEDIVDYTVWAKIYNDQKKKDMPKADVSADTVSQKELRRLVENGYTKSISTVMGTEKDSKSSQKMLAFLERSAAAAFGTVVTVSGSQRFKEKIGTAKKLWVREGTKALSAVTEFLNSKGNPDTLSNSDFVELCQNVTENNITTVGVQSALMQILSQKGVDENRGITYLLAAVPEFSTLLRLYFASFIMKLAVLELFMVVFGQQGVFKRIRANRVLDDFDNLVVDTKYEKLTAKARSILEAKNMSRKGDFAGALAEA